MIINTNTTPWVGVSHDADVQKQVFLKLGDIAHITQFARAIFKPGDTVPAHAHEDMIEVFYIQSGELTIIIDERQHVLTAGSSVTVEVGEEHAMSNAGEDDLELVYFGVRV